MDFLQLRSQPRRLELRNEVGGSVQLESTLGKYIGEVYIRPPVVPRGSTFFSSRASHSCYISSFLYYQFLPFPRISHTPHKTGISTIFYYYYFRSPSPSTLPNITLASQHNVLQRPRLGTKAARHGQILRRLPAARRPAQIPRPLPRQATKWRCRP